MKYSIRKLAEALLFENFDDENRNTPNQTAGVEPGHVRYGKFDRPVAQNQFEVPLDSNPMSTNDSLLNLPPVEDPDYCPTNSSELKLALYSLASLVDNESISEFYQRVYELVDEFSMPPMNLVSEARGVKREKMKLLGDTWLDNSDTGMEYSEDPREYERYLRDKNNRVYTIDDMVPLMNISVAGVHLALEKLQRKISLLAQDPDLAILLDIASKDFAKFLSKTSSESPEEYKSTLKELMSNREKLYDLNSFRLYITDSMINPGIKLLNRQILKKLKDGLSVLDMPPKTMDSVALTLENQFLGRTKRDSNHVRKAIRNSVPDEAEATRIYNDFLELFVELAPRLTPTNDALSRNALAFYNQLKENKKIDIFEKALDESPDADLF
jgi:hypothetical protein